MRITMAGIFPNAPAVTVHNGADEMPDELKNQPRPPTLAERLIVLCVAFFYQRKKVPLLIAAFDRIAARYPDALLLIIGDGADKSAVAAAVEAATHRFQVRLLGVSEHRDVLQHMIWCDVFECIGIEEPFGVVFAEPMMAGKPINYATDCGIADVVTHGVHGLGVVHGNRLSASMALDRLLGDAELRRRMGLAAAQLAGSRLTWANNAKTMTQMFEVARGRRVTEALK